MGTENFAMIIAYAFVIVFNLINVFQLVKAILNRKPMDIIICVGAIFFAAFMTSVIFLGGSAFNDAVANYELYEAGHYYLEERGHYIEVSRGAFVYMQIIQVIGILGFAVSFVTAMIKIKKEKQTIG